jgi:FlaA1/EpsC-like NDP-sugar epimerase
MSRFVMTISDAVSLVLEAGRLAKGGEIFILKMSALWVKDLINTLVQQYAPRVGQDPAQIETVIIGKRLGERMYQRLLADNEIEFTEDAGNMFVIHPQREIQRRKIAAIGRPREEQYDSEKAPKLLPTQIAALLKQAGLI